ncbi:MAG TPA: class I SAM-dependent methyltransferase [Usitatibacter sp.]|nr:class I SAM-dependent methyltransferase [Usitatibacter sp.]
MATVTGQALHLDAPGLQWSDGRPVLRTTLRVEAPVVFRAGFALRLHDAAGAIIDSASGPLDYLWLPRGTYRVDVSLPQPMPAGETRFYMRPWHQQAMAQADMAMVEGTFTAPGSDGPPIPVGWSVEALAPTPPLAALSWRKGDADWFYRHFDHAASIVQSYMLADSPLLRGRILDVGCGDGITDLSLALRTGCRELVGVDPFRGYERLREVMVENHLPPDAFPPNLRFMAESANSLPFADDSFDVVVSWGSLEHIAGGYDRALAEIRRVLRPEGLFFVHPGLYYCSFGHHLGEFSAEPHFHLKKPLDEVRRIVMEAPIRRMDRSGHVATREEYWQWFRELNPITVGRFEQELRALDFQPWRVALRTEAMVEYTPEIERYPMQDLATGEAYIACVSRKGLRRAT